MPNPDELPPRSSEEPDASGSSVPLPDTSDTKRHLLDSAQPGHQTSEQIAAELQRLRDAGEVAQESLPFDYVNELLQRCCPVMRSDLGNPPKAVVLLQEEVELIGCFVYIDAAGKIQSIDPSDMHESLVLLPSHFGNADQGVAQAKFIELYPNGLGTIE